MLNILKIISHTQSDHHKQQEPFNLGLPNILKISFTRHEFNTRVEYNDILI